MPQSLLPLTHQECYKYKMLSLIFSTGAVRAVSFQRLLRLLRPGRRGGSGRTGRIGRTGRTRGHVLVTTRCSRCWASTNPTDTQRGLQNVVKSPQQRAVRRFQTESSQLHRNLFVAPSHDFEGSDQRFQSGDLEI